MTKDNDTPDEPKDAKILSFAERTIKRIEEEDKAPWSARVFTPDNTFEAEVPEEPEAGNYDVKLVDGTEFEADGFIVATSTFVGFADDLGCIRSVIPMGQLQYVKQTDEIEVEVE